ncbi:hypothetical protein [Streptomyces sp. I4(2020)]|uniref:hypothetical protein n=1 Tax=Streptomyces sp. I4(2020) TaxID=2760981 RepID=UPI001E47CFB4|nr:hypothetical protein [Streptomyces sp. I4(2020)]
MSTPRRPSLKSITTAPAGPHAAPQPVDPAAVGEPKGVARQGVLTALPRSNQPPAGGHPAPSPDPTPDRPGLRVYAPPVYRHHYDGARWSKRYSATPTAAYACPCGETRTARGQDAVAALVTEYDAHKHFCTGKPDASPEGRTAA